jgi:hypothetical protein
VSATRWLAVLTFALIVAANVLGFMTNAGLDVFHTHATVGLLAELAGLAFDDCSAAE